jgi:glycosyltransferase involved in cell wall biosynthesis
MYSDPDNNKMYSDPVNNKMYSDPVISVVHLAPMQVGGIDRHVRDIVATVRRGQAIWHVSAALDVLELSGEPRFIPLAPSRGKQPAAQALLRFLRDAGVGLVHVHSVDTETRARLAWLRERLDLPYLVTLHDVSFLDARAFERAGIPEPDAQWIAALGPVIEGAAAVIAPSECIRALAAGAFPRARLTVVANGIAADAASRPALAPRAEFTAHAPKQVVAVAGAIGPHKGADLVEALPALLEASDIGIVVIGYTDRRLTAGWVVPGRLYVHGPYEEDELVSWLRGYRAQVALFPNQLPEGFGYALSQCWAAQVPALVAPDGALAERVGAHGGGWLLPAGFDAPAVAARLRALLGPEGTAELKRVHSALQHPSPLRIPTLAAMASDLETLYARFAVPGAAGAAAPDARALESLVAANLEGMAFRRELVKLAEELDELRGQFAGRERDNGAWIAKLQGDIDALNAELAREVEERRRLGGEVVQLGIHKQAFDLLPEFVRRILLKRVLDAIR